MACCRFRSSLSECKRFPGGTLRSSSLVARCTYSNLRAARLATSAGKRFACPVVNKSRVRCSGGGPMRFYNHQHQQYCGIDLHGTRRRRQRRSSRWSGPTAPISSWRPNACSRNETIDSLTIAVLLRGGLLPRAYVCPAEMRSTRDLLRRRLHLVRTCGERLAHIQNMRAQYHLPECGRRRASTSSTTSPASIACRSSPPMPV